MTADHLTTGQIARQLGVTTQTVQRWADRGEIPVAFVTPGGHRRFTRQDVEEFVRSMSVTESQMKLRRAADNIMREPTAEHATELFQALICAFMDTDVARREPSRQRSFSTVEMIRATGADNYLEAFAQAVEIQRGELSRLIQEHKEQT